MGPVGAAPMGGPGIGGMARMGGAANGLAFGRRRHARHGHADAGMMGMPGMGGAGGMPGGMGMAGTAADELRIGGSRGRAWPVRHDVGS